MMRTMTGWAFLQVGHTLLSKPVKMRAQFLDAANINDYFQEDVLAVGPLLFVSRKDARSAGRALHMMGRAVRAKITLEEL